MTKDVLSEDECRRLIEDVECAAVSTTFPDSEAKLLAHDAALRAALAAAQEDNARLRALIVEMADASDAESAAIMECVAAEGGPREQLLAATLRRQKARTRHREADKAVMWAAIDIRAALPQAGAGEMPGGRVGA